MIRSVWWFSLTLFPVEVDPGASEVVLSGTARHATGLKTDVAVRLVEEDGVWSGSLDVALVGVSGLAFTHVAVRDDALDAGTTGDRSITLKGKLERSAGGGGRHRPLSGRARAGRPHLRGLAVA